MKNDNIKEDISYPIFLDNKPCGQDLFEGKSHEKIAKNITTIIENGVAKVIGIDGGWGSGKSNMVNLIKAELDKNKYHFFIYDAWGHQTDFQRRSILENLTSFLVEKAKILEEEKWNAKLLQLLSRKRSVGAKVVKELSAVAKVSAIIAFSMPLLIFFSELIDNNIFKFVYWIIIIILSLSLLIYLQVRNMKKYGQIVNLSNIINELFLSYLDYTNEKESIEQSIKYETIYDEEPSTRDFKNWMNDINKDLEKNTLIIVFDNMDRLPREKVQELWSAIHTFFAEENYKNIYVIVPFDREHIKSAFKTEDIFIHSENTNSNKEVVCYGNDFINKTFDVVFRVSPPVMSDWKTFFASQWKKAFGIEIDIKITQIYDILSETITPREIIAFINEIVSIKQVSDSSIPDEYIALFVKGKDKISENPDVEILHPSYLGALDYLYKNDQELPIYISALYYQLPVDKALDIIYTENLKKALDNGEIKQIKLIQEQPHLFYNIIENAITKVSNIYNTIHALDECLINKDPKQEDLIWDCVYKKFNQESTDEPLEYQKILLKRITNKDDYLKQIISDRYPPLNFSAISFYNSIKQLTEIDGIDPFKYLTEKDVDAEQFIKFVEEAKDDYKKYKIICKQEKIDEYLSKLSINDLTNTHAIQFLKEDYELPLYISHLNDLIDQNLNNINSIKIIYYKLKEINKSIIKKLPDAQIHSYFNTTNNTDDFYYDLLCMRISRLVNFQQNLQPLFNAILNNEDDDLVEKVAETIEYYISYEDILINIEKMNYPIYNAVAKKLTEKGCRTSKINPITVIPKYELIKNKLGIEPEIIINRIDSLCNDASSKITTETINKFPPTFYKDIMIIKNNLTDHCINTAKKYLETKSKEEWKTAIVSDNFDFQLLMTIKTDIQTCFDAFKELLIENIQNANSGFSKSKCGSLIELFEKNGREMLSAFNTIRDCFCSGKCTMTNEIFNYYGEWLLKYAKLEENPSSLRTIFTSTIIDDKNNVQLILKYKEKMIRIVDIAGDENKDFKDKIKDLLNNDDYKDDNNFEDFASSIGIVR